MDESGIYIRALAFDLQSVRERESNPRDDDEISKSIEMCKIVYFFFFVCAEGVFFSTHVFGNA